MRIPPNDRALTGSIPELYERYLVPMIFEFFAADLAARLARSSPRRILELACGTGAVTRALASTLPRDVAIIATDLNPAMLERACVTGTSRPVEWRQADAQHLPFGDDAFDAVVCQFGVMFFPDKPRAFAEARRVLRPGGLFLFNVWDRIEENEVVNVAEETLSALFPDAPPRFMSRTPHGYFNHATIAHDLALGGFSTAPNFSTVTDVSVTPSAEDAALGICQGSPLRGELEALDPARLAEATDAVASALREQFGRGSIEGKMQACVVSVTA